MGRYRILEFLGEGRFGKIYKVKDLNDGGVYALKEAKDRDFSEKLLEEAQNVLLLDHPNLVKLHRYHLSKDKRKIYLIYEYCEGGDLGTYVEKRGGRLAPGEALAIIKQIASGLAYLHGMGYIHLDIKPENVLKKGEIWKLGDFGLLKPRGYYGILDVKGTVGYIAPEVFKGEIHRSSDIFSLGCLFYYTLEGEHPFKASNRVEELKKNKKGYVPIPTALEGNLAEIFKKMVDRDPFKRYRTASELLKDLEKIRGV